MFDDLSPSSVLQLCLSPYFIMKDPHGPEPRSLAHLPGHLLFPVWVCTGPGPESKGSLLISPRRLCLNFILTERDLAQGGFQLGLFNAFSMRWEEDSPGRKYGQEAGQ